jgi:hypothetical protein
MEDSKEGAEKDPEGIKVITCTRTAAKHFDSINREDPHKRFNNIVKIAGVIK